MDDGAFLVVGHAGEDQVDVLAQARSDVNLGGGLLAGLVEAPLRKKGSEKLAIFGYIDVGAVADVVVVLRLLQLAQNEAVVPQGDFIAGLQLRCLLHREGVAHEADEEQRNAEVDDVAAVAAGVAVGQVDGRRQPVHFLFLPNHARAAVELRHDGGNDEGGEENGHQRVEAAHTVGEAGDGDHRREQQRTDEVPAQALYGGASPGEQRRHAGQEQEEQSHGDGDFVEVGRPDGDLDSFDRLGNQREHRSPQHRKHHRQQDEVVEQEARLPRQHGVQVVFASQERQSPQQDGDSDRQANDEEGGEVRPDGGGGKGVHRAENAAAGQEGAEDAEEESGKNQHHVPDFHHPALLLHHHRMQEGGAGEPRQQGSVLDRVPAPVAAPAQHRVGPAPAEDDADGQESPRDHAPAARDVDPVLAFAAGNQRGEGEGERHGETDEAQIEHGRVDDHSRVLQQRVQPATVGRRKDL